MNLEPVHWPPIGLVNWSGDSALDEEIQVEVPSETSEGFLWSAKTVSHEEITARFQIKNPPIGCGRYGKVYQVQIDQIQGTAIDIIC